MTIAQQLGVKDYPFIIKDSRGNQIYIESITGYWHKSRYDLKNNEIYFEDSSGFWRASEFINSERVYYENSEGEIIDNRPKPITKLTMD